MAGEELKTFKLNLPNDIGEPLKYAPNLILWTERGANRHCKIIDTNKAWGQFDVLEETYFKAKPISVEDAIIASMQAQKEIKLQLKQVNAGISNHDNRLEKLEEIQSHKAEIMKDLPPVNPLTQRAQLNQIIRGYAERNCYEYSRVWSKLYEHFLSRYSINLKTRAKNRNQSVLDFAQYNGYLADLLALAIELFC